MWRNLLEALIANPHQRLSELPLLSAAEQRAVQDSLSIEAGEHRLDQCIHPLFSQQAAARGDAPALTFAGETLSYRELEARANRLAWMLRERGVGPQVRVGLALPRSLEMVIGLLAILKAGGAYVPLDPEYPLDRLHYMIEDSGIGLLLSDATMFAALGELPASVACWCLEDDLPVLANYPADALPFISLAQHQAYLIYTSGSTGKPKGVVVSHGEIAMHCAAVIERFGMRADDCELHFYSINFDAATERLLVPLLSGAQVVLRAQGQWDAEEICGLIRTHGINILGFTPSYGMPRVHASRQTPPTWTVSPRLAGRAPPAKSSATWAVHTVPTSTNSTPRYARPTSAWWMKRRRCSRCPPRPCPTADRC